MMRILLERTMSDTRRRRKTEMIAARTDPVWAAGMNRVVNEMDERVANGAGGILMTSQLLEAWAIWYQTQPPEERERWARVYIREAVAQRIKLEEERAARGDAPAGDGLPDRKAKGPSVASYSLDRPGNHKDDAPKVEPKKGGPRGRK